jgi:hypothetical protein
MGKASSLDQRINPSSADQIFESQRLQRSADEDWILVSSPALKGVFYPHQDALKGLTMYEVQRADESLSGDEIVERLALADDGRSSTGDEDFCWQRAGIIVRGHRETVGSG